MTRLTLKSSFIATPAIKWQIYIAASQQNDHLLLLLQAAYGKTGQEWGALL